MGCFLFRTFDQLLETYLGLAGSEGLEESNCKPLIEDGLDALPVVETVK